MAQVKNFKEMAGWTNAREIVTVEYDFAKDGGAVGALDIAKALQGMVVHGVIAKVKTTCTSAGAATVALGKSGDVAGLIAATPVASLVAGAVIDQASFGSGYKLELNDTVLMTIATAALTAGKICFELEVSKF